MTNRLARAAMGAVAVALAATACGPHPQASIAIRSTALDLQFARPDLAKPIPPNVILHVLPAPPGYVVPTSPGVSFSVTTPTPKPPVGQCPPVSQRPKPAAPLRQATTGSPRAGLYLYATKGTGTVSGGAQNVSAPMPSRAEVSISDASKATPDAAAAAEGGVPPSGTETEYTVTTRLSNNLSEVDELMVSASSINLVQRTLSDGQRTMLFTPKPQVQLVRFGAVGSTWKSSGTDASSGAVMNFQGAISGTKALNVCGRLVNTYVVTYSESLTNPAEAEVIRTSSTDPNLMLIAPQLGGLIVSQHVDTDDIRFQADLSGYIGITLRYTTTVTNLSPSSKAAGS